MWLARPCSKRNEQVKSRRKSLWFLPAFLLCLLAGGPIQGQGFQVHVTLPAGLKGKPTLTLFDTPQPRTVKSNGDHGTDFSGTVKGPVYAELRHPAVAQPVAFFIENSRINITFNKEQPNASPITGSRTNSLLRFQLEQCADNLVECLSLYITEHPDDILSPYLLDQQLAPSLDFAMLDTLYKQLQGAATKTYHYQLLGKRMRHLTSLADGAPLPSFRFSDDKSTPTASDTVMRDSCYHLLMIGATWCEQCSRIAKELAKEFPDIKPYVINIDRQKMQWDANLVEVLAVDHIPYLILLDPQKRIVARDLRIWELKRILEREKAEKP